MSNSPSNSNGSPFRMSSIDLGIMTDGAFPTRYQYDGGGSGASEIVYEKPKIIVRAKELMDSDVELSCSAKIISED